MVRTVIIVVVLLVSQFLQDLTPGSFEAPALPQRRVTNMADIGKKIKEAAMNAAKDKISGDKKGKRTRDSESGVDKAKRTLTYRLK